MNIKQILAAQGIYSAEHHLHNDVTWYGDGGSGTLAENLTRIQLTAGIGEAFSAGEQIYGGTEIEGGNPARYVDFHSILVTAVSAANNLYVLQLIGGAGVIGDGTIMTHYSGFFPATGKAGPIYSSCRKVPCNFKIWIKTKCETDGATIDIMVGPHIYP